LEAVNRELADSALSDALTGLRNRRFLRQYLEQDAQAFTKHAEERRRKPQGFALSYFLFDLDHFKQINDCFGHDAGDSVLVAVAQRIRQTLRTGDAAMRWGGEEFLIVARRLDLEGSQSLAARILEAVAAQPMTLPSGEPLWVSASLGYTPWPWSEVSDAPDAQVDEYHLAVSLADAATYLAKIGGRNRAYGVLPGRDTEFAHRLASLSLGPGTLREEDGRGVRLLSLLGPQRSDAARR
jgi:diguanylate cyclase (GGDEF)-like protein